MSGCTTTNVVPGCFDGTPVMIHVTDDGLGKSATRIIDISGDIVVGADATNTEPGACRPLTFPALRTDGQNISSGTFDPVFFPSGGATNTWSHSPGGGRLQSVTVTAQRAGLPNSGNTIKITLASGRELFILQGQSHTWSVGQDNADTSESIDGVIVTAAGNAAASIVWTEQA